VSFKNQHQLTTKTQRLKGQKRKCPNHKVCGSNGNNQLNSKSKGHYLLKNCPAQENHPTIANDPVDDINNDCRVVSIYRPPISEKIFIELDFTIENIKNLNHFMTAQKDVLVQCIPKPSKIVSSDSFQENLNLNMHNMLQKIISFAKSQKLFGNEKFHKLEELKGKFFETKAGTAVIIFPLGFFLSVTYSYSIPMTSFEPYFQTNII